jgi:hypothetical protein
MNKSVPNGGFKSIKSIENDLKMRINDVNENGLTLLMKVLVFCNIVSFVIISHNFRHAVMGS